MIKLSQTWYYALHAVTYVAQKKWELVTIRDISIWENISEPLLRRIIAQLEKAHILKTVRGRSWGVLLAIESSRISLYDILFAVGEELGVRDCTKWVYCSNKDQCSTTDVLGQIQKWFNSLLKINTLDKFIK